MSQRHGRYHGRICIGGTFSPIHKGHMALLEEAFRNGDMVYIGLTSDRMAKAVRERGVEDFIARSNELSKEADRLSKLYGVPYSITEIDDEIGFADSSTVDSIAASRETEGTIDIIDRERLRGGLPPLRRFIIEMVLADDGSRISSTRVAAGEVGADGKVVRGGICPRRRKDDGGGS